MYHAAIAARQRLKDECNTPASLRLAGDEALPFPDYFSPISPLIRYAEKLDAQGPNRESQLVAFYARRAALMAVARLVAADPTAASGAFDAALAKADAAALRRARAAVSTAAQAAYARAEETRSERPAERARRGETDASRAIARDFHRAWCFFEVLRQFGAVDAALAIKASYAKYAATQALK
ncbi:hypothetical protein M885DRAFT_531991 [Pelagophyceae sp. CCMP2097]|nr:hypothetical protein M885DRAFT_531991 [Pelagophyceae sp. CCMP2097]